MKYLSTLILLISLPFTSFGQKEFGIFLGGTGYQGDLVQPTFSTKGVGITGGLLYKHYFEDNIALRGGLNFGQFSGDDEFFAEETRGRGFNFSTNFINLSASLEYSFFGSGGYTPNGEFEKIFSPYAYIGIGYLYTNPEVNTDGRIALNAEDENPKQNHVSFPIGVGLKYDLSSKVNIAGEFSIRNPFTDLLDGIAQSGDPGDYDWYWTTGVTLLYKFGMRQPLGFKK